MSLFSAMAVSGSGMDAQSIRLNTIASNLANANVVAGSEAGTYRARYPVFATVMDSLSSEQGAVRVDGILESQAPAIREYSPGHPMADAEGFVYRPAINQADEMANMAAAARAFQSSVQAIETTKQLALRTLTLGR